MKNIFQNFLGGLNIPYDDNPQLYQARINQARQAMAAQARAKQDCEDLGEGKVIEGEIVKEEPKLLEDKSNGTKI